MDHIIQFLLIGLIFTIISKVESQSFIRDLIEGYSKDDGMNIINSNHHTLKVSKEILQESVFYLVCKGKYDDKPVAIKITTINTLFNDEMKAYDALMGDNPQSHGIQKIHYHGNAFGGACKAIAISMFEETVEQRYKNQSTGISKPFSDYNILHIFEQAVQILEYLHIKRVWHNNIMPHNLLLYGTDVFLADFHLATLNETQGDGHTYEYASSNRFAKQPSCAMDDFESLIFSMWHVAGFDFSAPYGSLLMEMKKNEQAKLWVTVICKRFKFDITQKVFTDICIHELLNGAKVPRYKHIIRMLSDAKKTLRRLHS